MSNRRHFIKSAIAMGTLAVAGQALASPRSPSGLGADTQLRLGITDLSFHRMAGALVTAVLEQRGYRVTRSHAPHEANFERLASGEIDLLASAWLPASHGIYKAEVEKQVAVRELGLHYQPYALWGAPDYVPVDQVAEVADLLRPEVRQRITPQIQGIGPGAGISRFSREIMTAYGLEQAGYRFLNGTQEQCLAAFEQAVAEQRWAIVPLWRPQFLHAIHPIRELKEPRGLLGGVDRAVLLIREDRLGRLDDATLTALDKLRFGNELIERLDYRVSRLGEPLDRVAREAIAALQQPA